MSRRPPAHELRRGSRPLNRQPWTPATVSTLGPLSTNQWELQRQREQERRTATAQRRKGYKAGWYNLPAEAGPPPPVHQNSDRIPLSAEAVEWVLSDQPGQRMTVSALNDVFQPQSKAEREDLAQLVARTCTVARFPGEPDLVMLRHPIKAGGGSRPTSPGGPARTLWPGSGRIALCAQRP